MRVLWLCKALDFFSSMKMSAAEAAEMALQLRFSAAPSGGAAEKFGGAAEKKTPKNVFEGFLAAFALKKYERHFFFQQHPPFSAALEPGCC